MKRYNQQKWDQRWVKVANLRATFSGDHRRHVGCVVVGEGETELSAGWNDLPRRVMDVPHRRAYETKLPYTEHAERNAIYNAARNGVRLSGSRLYSTFHPCADCARGIIQSGIIEVVCPNPTTGDIGRWGADFAAATEMFDEAGVRVRFISFDEAAQ